MKFDKILINSGYGKNTRQPFVQMSTDKWMVQISPEEARDLAGNLLQAAEAAEQDAFLFEFTMDTFKDEHAAGLMVAGFRKWRVEHGMNR